MPPDHPVWCLSTTMPVIMLRWPLGGPTGCDWCGGRGYYPDGEPTDRYCECPAGKVRWRTDG